MSREYTVLCPRCQDDMLTVEVESTGDFTFLTNCESCGFTDDEYTTLSEDNVTSLLESIDPWVEEVKEAEADELADKHRRSIP